MLGKLIKHEFRATGRLILPMLAVVLFISLFARFAFRILDGSLPVFLSVFLYLVIAAFFFGLVGAFVYTFAVMIVRFRRNVLGDEGYLTMTLPVSIHSILWAKIIVSLVWGVAVAVVAVLCVALAAMDVNWISGLLDSVGFFFRAFAEYDNKLEAVGWLISGIAYAIIFAITNCLNVYSCMAFGFGFARHKVLMSVGAFFLLGIVMSWVSGSGLQMLVVMNEQVLTDVSFSTGFYQNYAVVLATQLFKGAVYYVITWLNLKYRLSLE